METIPPLAALAALISAMAHAVNEMGKKDLVIIGYDSGKAQKDAIRSGLMAGAITQNPVGIGYETVKAALEAAQGKEVPAHIDTGFYYYDSSNIDDFKDIF